MPRGGGGGEKEGKEDPWRYRFALVGAHMFTCTRAKQSDMKEAKLERQRHGNVYILTKWSHTNMGERGWRRGFWDSGEFRVEGKREKRAAM